MKRFSKRIFSVIFSSSITNGGVKDALIISISETSISTSPVGIFLLTVPSGRFRTLHLTFKTYSLLTVSAILNASGVSGSITICARPSLSLRSIKMTPP